MNKIVFLFLYLLSLSTSYSQSNVSNTPPINKNLVTTFTSIPIKDGDSLYVTVVLDKTVTTPLPAILMYSIYAGPNDEKNATRAANLGYVGVVVNTRGKKTSNSTIAPFEHDAGDAYEVIEWISNQPWCNKKIGMYGGSYLGFSQWAATKSLHPALKTIIPQAAVGIGIDFPMQNNVFMNYSLSWIHYVTNNKETDIEDFRSNRWSKASNRWFKEGTAYNTLDSIDGRPNAIFQQWLANPSYNEYWQKMVPYKEEFVNINIPVLTITGYYDVDQTGAMYYYREHHKYNKNANHYLVIGPYDHFGAQGTQGKKVGNYAIDEAANVNFNKLAFEWFDYILKDGKKPDMLENKVNYQVMGTNEWKHTPTLSAMNNDTLTFYLSPEKIKKKYLLSQDKPQSGSIPYTVDFKSRNRYNTFSRTTNWYIELKRLRKGNYMEFVSMPLEEPLSINGNFIGELKATINKKDMDFVVELYELKPDGTYFSLSGIVARASYAKDRSNRQLLTPGEVETIPFSNTFFTSRQLEKGSRIVILIGINKNSHWQINYGTGKDVSEETITDAKESLEILWHSDSFIKLPVYKEKKDL